MKNVIRQLARIGALPVFIGAAGRLLEFLPRARLDVAHRVGAEAVEAVLAHPVGVPLDQVVARRARIAGALEEVVQFLRFAFVAPFLLPLGRQRGRQGDRRIDVGAEVRQVLHQRAVDGAVHALEVARGRGAYPGRRPRRVLRRDRAGMVHHHVQQHAHAARVGGVDQVVQVFLGAQVGVDGREVARPVAVEAVGQAGALVGRTVDLLDGRRDPQRVHAQVVEIPFLDLGRDAGQVAAHVAARRRRIVLASVGVVVGAVGVVEAVGQQEVDGGAVPGEGARRGGRGGYGDGGRTQGQGQGSGKDGRFHATDPGLVEG
jgi:hypothetical protein